MTRDNLRYSLSICREVVLHSRFLYCWCTYTKSICKKKTTTKKEQQEICFLMDLLIPRILTADLPIQNLFGKKNISGNFFPHWFIGFKSQKYPHLQYMMVVLVIWRLFTQTITWPLLYQNTYDHSNKTPLLNYFGAVFLLRRLDGQQIDHQIYLKFQKMIFL